MAAVALFWDALYEDAGKTKTTELMAFNEKIRGIAQIAREL